MAKRTRRRGKRRHMNGEIVAIGRVVVPIIEVPKMRVKVIDTRTTKLSYTCSLEELMEKLR